MSYPSGNIYPPIKLSGLIIDVDKDWVKRNITNFGEGGIDLYGTVMAHASRHASGGADAIPVRGIARSQLEYPTIGVSFAYLSAINKLAYCSHNIHAGAVLTVDNFADKSVRAITNPRDYATVTGRFVDAENFYECHLAPIEATADHRLLKVVAGSVTILATEAVDIDTTGEILAISCLGSTIKSLRRLIIVPVAQASIPAWTATLPVTDTSLSSGKFGVRPMREAYQHGFCDTTSAMLDDPLSPTPKPAAFFEVPVVGSGTLEDPFRAQMPEEVVVDWSLNPTAKKKYDVLKAKGFTDEEIAILVPEVLSVRKNLLALTHSSLIKTDRATGKPVDYVAIVRVFDQPDRGPALRPISKCLNALRAMPGVKELTRDEAIKRAKQIDPDLTDVDLLPISPSSPDFKAVLRDYIAHREALGVKRELIDDKLMERCLAEEKGW